MSNPDRSILGLIQKIPRGDGLAITGTFLFLVSMVFPWVSATDDRLNIDGEATDSMAGWLATDVRILLAVVIICLVLAVGVRLTLDDTRLTIAFIGLAGLAIVSVTGVYLVDPYLGLTDGLLRHSGVYAGVGIYIAFIGGVLILAGVLDSLRVRRANTPPYA